jgi:hypothetical protein
LDLRLVLSSALTPPAPNNPTTAARAYVGVEQGSRPRDAGVDDPVVILSVAYAVQLNDIEGTARLVRCASAASLAAALAPTIIFNVPINLATGKWDAEKPPADWKEARNRWEFFQGVRSWHLLGFVLLSLAITLRS